jgi:hypothetical protein
VTGRQRNRLAFAVLLAVVLVGIVVVIHSATSGNRSRAKPPCSATIGAATYRLDLAQASNATTIAAVAKRDGFPDHAVTVALAVALQESDLRNLAGGDRDSLGLFQQRPSQGWGTRAEILTPRYAAGVFYQHLARIPDWQNLPVTDAAQRVQHSAAPAAYAQWEPEARVLAEAITGETPAAFACRLGTTSLTATDVAAMSSSARLELGIGDLSTELVPPRGWVVASWLIGHAEEFHVASLSYNGWRWTATGGSWTAHAPAVTRIQINAA